VRRASPTPPPARSPGNGEAGFTLVELLVSLFIFGMLSAAGVALLSFSVRAQEASALRLDELSRLRRASTLLAGDLGQAAPRIHRDESGLALPAFTGEGAALGLVRRGWENVDGDARSSLQRVEYRLAGDRLERVAYPMVDGAPPRAATTILAGVRTLRLRYRYPEGDWRDRWDPKQPGDLPLAVELVADVAGTGTTRQLFLTGRGW
jgi:general secretion pathway protein J